MTKTLKRVALAAAAATAVCGLTACAQPADVASKNLSLDADNFKIARKITVINGITDKYLLTIQGFCSLGNDRTSVEISVTCKVDGAYKKTFVGISDNVTYLIEQLDPADVSASHYKVSIRPGVLIPDIDFSK